jgi:peptidoglycan/xylan/chitin deacetylase (PgdA/CDA1 family)
MIMQQHIYPIVIASKKTTRPIRVLYLFLVAGVSLIIIASAFLIKEDPRLTQNYILSTMKRLMYTGSYIASSAGANALSALDTERNERAPRTIPVLVYHGIVPKPDGINLTEEHFKDHIFALKKAGYETVTLNDLYRVGKEGATLPDRSVLITFDDGRADSFYNGDPILASVGYSAVIFPVTGYTEKASMGGYYLSPEELLLMAKTGRWEIGSHSNAGHEQYRIDETGNLGNFFTNHLWNDTENRVETTGEFEARITEDFDISRSYLEDLLGKRVRSFAFPFGDIGQDVVDEERSKEILTAASGSYDILFFQHQPGSYFTQLSPKKTEDTMLLVRRINVNDAWGAEKLLDVIKDGEEKTLPYDDTFDNNNGWIKIWGEPIINNGTLSLQASPQQAGASTVLDGTALWGDYETEARVVSPRGTGVLLWTRFQDEKNNAACNFGPEFVHVEQVLNGEKRVLSGVRRPNMIPSGTFTLTVRTEGRTVICSINGVEIVRTEFLNESLSHGGIGIKIWDPVLGKSSVIVEELHIKSITR